MSNSENNEAHDLINNVNIVKVKNLTLMRKEGQERYIKINVIGVIIISFLVTVGFGAANLIVPYYILALKGVLTQLPEKLEAVHAERAVVEIGAMTSSFMATRAVFAALSGWMSDRLGRKPMIISGMTLYTILGVLYALTTAPWQLIALMAVQGVASAFVWPVAEALLVDSVISEIRTRALSLYVIMMNAGQVIGPVIGSVAYEISKKMLAGTSVIDIFRVPFLIITIAILPGAILVLFLKEPRERKIRSGEEMLEKFKGGLLRLPKAVKRALASFYISGILNGLAAGIISSVMIVYVIDFIAKTPVKVGMALSISGIAGLIVAYPAAHYADRLNDIEKKSLLLLTYVVARVLLGIIGFIRGYWIFILIVAILDVTMNVSMPLLRSIQAGLVPSKLRGRVFGLQQAFFNSGMVIGPLLGAYIYKHYFNSTFLLGLKGVQMSFIIAAALGLVGVALIFLYYNPEAVRNEWKSFDLESKITIG